MIKNKLYTSRLRSAGLSMAAMAAIAGASQATAAGVFYEDFTSEPASSWDSGGNTFIDTSGSGTLNIGGGGFAKYSLPFDDSDASLSGGVYSLSVDWAINGDGITDDDLEFYFGFGTGTVDGGAAQGEIDGFIDNELAYGFRFNNVDFLNAAGGNDVTVNFGDGPSKAGINDFSTTISRASTTDVWSANFRIDVNVPGDLVSYYVNDVKVGEISGSVSNIGGVWFKGDRMNSSVYFNIDNVGVSAVAVPEPSSTVLLGLAGMALILRRRK